MTTHQWPGSPFTEGEWFEEAPAYPPPLEVEVADNPVVMELLGPDGEVIRQWLEREPIGFRLR